MQSPDKSLAVEPPSRPLGHTASRAGSVVVWSARAVWLAFAVLGGSAIGQAAATHGRAVQLTATVGCWVAWAVVAMALVLPSTIGLTIVRTIVPAGVVVGVVAAFHGAGAAEAAVCVGLSALMVALVGAGEFGHEFAEGSAYGHERRFVLRPPVAFLVPAVCCWCVLCAAAVSGPLLLAAGVWWAGVPLVSIAVAGGWFLGRRFHLLSRRWLVLVPAGLVVHDQLVLAETVMVPRATVRSLGLALIDTQAADLTGPASGHAVEVVVADMITVVLAPTRATPNGTALHLRAMLVSPSRPGRLLQAAAGDRFPVG